MDNIKINEGRLKHLEMIQAVIVRMSSNSFLIKGWTITLVAALLAMAIQYNNKYIPIIAIFVILAFWYLDYYFLSLERQYRKLWDKKTQELQDSPTDFSMNISNYKCKFCSAFFCKINCVFYVALESLACALLFILHYGAIKNV